MNEWYLVGILLLAVGRIPSLQAGTPGAFERIKCKSREGLPFRPHSDERHRLGALRDQMRIRASLEGSEIEGYIITSYDEHLNEDINDSDKRRQYISGFTGASAEVAITMFSCALWTDERYLRQADAELNCDWEIFDVNKGPTMPEWLASHLKTDVRVGADPHTVPHHIWLQWESELASRFLRLIRINRNLVDMVWIDRPKPPADLLEVHPVTYAGEKWQSKVESLRAQLVEERCDAIVISELTDIAYLLNLRGRDLPHTPVFKAYLIVTLQDVYLYTNSKRAKLDMGFQLHLKTQPCYTEKCVKIRDYNSIWADLRTFAYGWRRVWIPNHCVFDLGSSEAIYSALSRHLIYEKASPIIFMKAQKNAVEREGMQRAHVLDGAAMCEALSLLESRFINGDKLSEMSAIKDVDLSRYALRSNKGTSVGTIVAFGPHGALPHFRTFNQTDMDITAESTIIIDSGGQYLEGTTAVTRTLHMGEPTKEQKEAYTNVLQGIIRLSTLIFPDDLKPAKVDTITRSPVWGSLQDYPQATGHGIGSYLSVQESPINLEYTESNQYLFKDGYFFSTGPAFYKQGQFGIRLENVLEVISTEKRLPSGAKFLRFQDMTLVPYDPKLIERALLSSQEKRWLNEYNARIRDLVGEELKAQMNMQAFYWMMNKTRHIIEYLPESEYRLIHGSSSSIQISYSVFIVLILGSVCHMVLK